MTGLWAFEEHLPYQKYQRSPIVVRFVLILISGAFGDQNAMTPQQRAQYLPVMQALLKVMETKYPSAQDINTLMVLTRDLSNQVPKGQNLLGNFGNFGLEGMESMGLPESGDIIVNVDGTPHIRTQWGK